VSYTDVIEWRKSLWGTSCASSPTPISIYVNDAEREDIEAGLDHLVETFGLKSRSELIKKIATGELLVSIPRQPPRRQRGPEPEPTGDPDLLAAMRRHRR
jgi:hypothetical protein